MRRDNILKYLHRISRPIDPNCQNHQPKAIKLNGLEGTFALENFDAFINSYKRLNTLASEAVKGFSVLLDALNDFCDAIEGITEEDVRTSIIEWYSNATVASTDIIRAKSKYYNASAFSDIAISMNTDDAQNYNTAEGTCFGKVRFKINHFIYLL